MYLTCIVVGGSGKYTQFGNTSTAFWRSICIVHGKSAHHKILNLGSFRGSSINCVLHNDLGNQSKCFYIYNIYWNLLKFLEIYGICVIISTAIKISLKSTGFRPKIWPFTGTSQWLKWGLRKFWNGQIDSPLLNTRPQLKEKHIPQSSKDKIAESFGMLHFT